MHTTIKTNLTKINTIVHLGDIHVRLYKRHQEYSECFELLKKNLTDKYGQKNDVLFVVAGDINHAKTDMSPEMIQLSSKLLSDLASIAPTVVIAGNHDLNLANQFRLDSLTPIVDNLTHSVSTLHYLKDSGIYTIADTDIAVFSITGERRSWPSSRDCSSVKKIVLYHGPVYNAQTDGGYSINSRHVLPSDFDGFDAALLGDIHKYQIVQYRDAQAGTPVIAYCGSLLQQNHGESLEGHGWIEWDTTTFDHTFYELENPYGYVTVRVDSGNPILPQKFPKLSRIRVFAANTDSSQLKKLSAILRRKTTVLELTINRLSDSLSASNHTATVQQDVHDISYQNNLISDYIRSAYPETSQELLDRIFQLNTQLNTKLGDDDLPHNVVWRPINLKFDNLFSYGEGNEIHFKDMNGLYGVFSPNATGKTSAFDALCFALYDKTPRAFKGSHIMNTRTNSCKCELELEINGSVFKVVRFGERKKNGEVKVDVEFSKLNSDGEYINLSGEDRRATNAVIRSYVGEYEDFILTSLSVQNQNSLFIDLGQSDRKDLLGQFMGLTIFDRLFDLAAADIKEVSGALKRFNKDDFTQELVDIQHDYDETKLKYDQSSLEVARVTLSISELLARISDEYSRKIPLNGVIKDLRQVLTDKSNTVNSIQSYSVEVARLKERRSRIEESIQNILKELPIEDELLAAVDKKKRLLLDMNKLSPQYHQLKSVVDHKQKQILWLNTHKYDPNCTYCTSNTMVQDAMNNLETIESDKENLQVLADRMTYLQESIDQLSDVDRQEKLFRQKQKELSLINTEMIDNSKKLESYMELITEAKNKLQKLEHDIEEYDKNKAAILINDLLDKTISELETQQKTKTRELDILNKNAQQLHGELEVLKSRKSALVQKITEAKELEATYEAYELYMNAICRDGIPYRLMSKVIPFIQTTANNILSQVVEFEIRLDVDGKNINGKIIYDDTKSWPLELASGMEKFVSSLAIRIALMRISSLPRSNFLIIDEGLGVLDSENLSNMFMLFDVLKTEFDFLILISHLDITRDIADNLIEIRRENGFSYINTTS